MTVLALGHRSGINIGSAHILPLVSIAPAAIGALLPDIDIPQSKLGSRFKFLSKHLKHRGITHALLIPIALYIGMLSVQSASAGLVLSVLVGVLISMVYGYKKGGVVTLALIALTFILPNVGSSILFGLATGWLLHICEDMFNTKGLPLFWPISSHRFLWPIVCVVKTRHWSEFVFTLLWLGGCATWAFLSLGGLSVMEKLPFLPI